MFWWQPLLRPAGTLVSNALSYLEKRRVEKLIEKGRRLEDKLNKRRAKDNIPDDEMENVFAYYETYGEKQADDLETAIYCLQQYIDLLDSGRRLPAPEQVVWMAGYYNRKRNGRLTEADIKRARQTFRLPKKKIILFLCFGLVLAATALCVAIFSGMRNQLFVLFSFGSAFLLFAAFWSYRTAEVRFRPEKVNLSIKP